MFTNTSLWLPPAAIPVNVGLPIIILFVIGGFAYNAYLWYKKKKGGGGSDE